MDFFHACMEIILISNFSHGSLYLVIHKWYFLYVNPMHLFCLSWLYLTIRYTWYETKKCSTGCFWLFCKFFSFILKETVAFEDLLILLLYKGSESNTIYLWPLTHLLTIWPLQVSMAWNFLLKSKVQNLIVVLEIWDLLELKVHYVLSYNNIAQLVDLHILLDSPKLKVEILVYPKNKEINRGNSCDW